MLHGGSKRGLTLIEVMITMAIFVLVASIMLAAVREVTNFWTENERRRVLYERAAGVLDTIQDDLKLVLSQEPKGSTQAVVRLIGDIDRGTNSQRLMFVRAFESGPERALTSTAGDGRASDLMIRPNSIGASAPQAGTGVDGDSYTGAGVGDFRPLGGMAMIGYYVKNGNLYRSIKAPVEGPMTALVTAGAGQVLCNDVLFLSYEYWSQDTQGGWEEPPARCKPDELRKYPTRIWDSTRGILALEDFPFHRGKTYKELAGWSLNDPSDDIFPRKIRLTVTVDSPMPRCVYTKILDDIGENDSMIMVSKTRGFPDGGETDSYILVDREWMRVQKRMEDRFVIDQRGARGTQPAAHSRDAVVRCGKTFRRVVFIPGWRDDYVNDDAYKARKEAERVKQTRTRRVLQ